jgi:hypothetical protein
MSYDELGHFRPSIGQWLLAGLLTVITAGLGLAEWLGFRPLVRLFLQITRTNPWAWRWWDLTSFIVLGIGWLCLVYLSAYLYRRGLEKRRLGRTFGLVLMAQILVPLLVLGGLQLLAALTG